jgi:hypothetical protein
VPCAGRNPRSARQGGVNLSDASLIGAGIDTAATAEMWRSTMFGNLGRVGNSTQAMVQQIR